MEKEFVTYEQALALKELEFDERCIGRYCIVTEWEEPTGEILLQFIDCELSEKILVKAPLKQQVFRWFREKYNIVSEINVYSTTDGYAFSFKILCKKYTPFIDADDAWTTYKEAENACIDKLIEIANSQKDIDVPLSKQQSND